MKNFKMIRRLKFEDTIPFSIYMSTKTAITVCIAEVDGPITTGYFNIVTAPFDNDGLPYAVEHLIFTGSDEYPYNNFLKLWAKRSTGNNINAYTSHNRTYFTMSAATSTGFLTLMPIYLDHILYPTLKDSAYLTEVHHINGEGKSDGVVYRKAQEKERTPRHIIEKKVLQALYPGHCGYNSVIYGTTKNLRESTNNEKVKQFHEKFYRPENLTILITGKIKPDKIFQALLPLEEKIMSKKKKDRRITYWNILSEPLEYSVKDVEVFLPISDKTYGEVCIAWRKPSITHIYDYHGCLLLLRYLMKTKSNPLLQELFKIHDTWDFTCSFWKDSSYPYLQITLENVPVKKCDMITKQFIHKAISEVCTKGINMETIKRLIHETILDYRIDLEENNWHDTIACFLFNHIVYDNIYDLDQSFNYIRNLEFLKKKPERHFLDLLKKYFIDAPMVVVKGIPDSNKHDKLREEEVKHIIEQNFKKLGKQGLNQKEKELMEAIKNNNISVPEEVLAKIFKPPKYFTYHNSIRFTEMSSQHPKLKVKNLPLFTYLDDVDSNVFYLQVVMDASSIDTKSRFYIPLLVDVITKSPVKRGNQLLVYENLKNALFANTINVTSYIGINSEGHITHSISLLLQVELHNYENSIKWCKKILYDTKLTAESLKTSIFELLNNIDEYKVQGAHLAEILIDILLYTDDNHKFTYNMLRQRKFLSNIQERLNTDVGQKEVIEEIESIREVLTLQRNMFAYMAVNVNKLTKQIPDVYGPWNKFFSDCMSSEETKTNITSNWKPFTLSNNITHNGCIVGLESIDSIFFIQTCPCINNYQDPKWPVLEVYLTYLRQEGGPIWENIQDRQEYSDHFKLYTSVVDGFLNLKFSNLQSVRNIVTVYQIIKEIMLTHLDEVFNWNKYLFEKAKVSVILNCINNVSSIKRMINTSLTWYCTNVSYDNMHPLLKSILTVTFNDIKCMLDTYIKPLFDPKQCRTAIVCNISKVAEIEKAFQEMEFNFTVCKSLEELNDYIENMTN